MVEGPNPTHVREAEIERDNEKRKGDRKGKKGDREVRGHGDGGGKSQKCSKIMACWAMVAAAGLGRVAEIGEIIKRYW